MAFQMFPSILKEYLAIIRYAVTFRIATGTQNIKAFNHIKCKPKSSYLLMQKEMRINMQVEMFVSL